MELELTILDWIQLHLRCGFLDWLMPFVSGLSNHGEIWILLAAMLLLLRRQRTYGLSAACALTLDLIACNILLKPLIGRVRPFAFRPDFPLLVPHGGGVCRGLCLVVFRQPVVASGPGPGRRDGLLPAVSLRPLAHRRPGRRPAGRRRGLGRG